MKLSSFWRKQTMSAPTAVISSYVVFSPSETMLESSRRHLVCTNNWGCYFTASLSWVVTEDGAVMCSSECQPVLLKVPEIVGIL